ncbi:MAG: hypothetical protein BJ554DRAFT_2682, partial [Olpidium bornovanus]
YEPKPDLTAKLAAQPAAAAAASAVPVPAAAIPAGPPPAARRRRLRRPRPRSCHPRSSAVAAPPPAPAARRRRCRRRCRRRRSRLRRPPWLRATAPLQCLHCATTDVNVAMPFDKGEPASASKPDKRAIFSQAPRLGDPFTEAPAHQVQPPAGLDEVEELRAALQEAQNQLRRQERRQRTYSITTQADLAATKLDGMPATLWFNHLRMFQDEDDATWVNMKDLLQMHYGNDNEFMETSRRLQRLTQTGSVMEYTAQFNVLSFLLEGALSSRALTTQYFNNLADYVKRAIAAVPGNLDDLGVCQRAALQFDAATRQTRYGHQDWSNCQSRPDQQRWHIASDRPHLDARRPPVHHDARTPSAHHGRTMAPRMRDAHSTCSRDTPPLQTSYVIGAASQKHNSPLNPCKFCSSPVHFPSDCPLIPADLHAHASANIERMNANSGSTPRDSSNPSGCTTTSNAHALHSGCQPHQAQTYSTRSRAFCSVLHSGTDLPVPH